MNCSVLTYKQQAIWLIFISTAIKLALGGWIEFNNDEAYYWTYAEKLQWNYFDHPPMIAALLRPWTINPFFHHEFFLRFPFIVLGAVSCWILFCIGKLLADECTGFIAACLFTASFYGNFIGGMLVLPDAPLLFFWLLTSYVFLRMIYRKTNRSSTRTNLLLAGVLIGLSILSKAQGIFLWIGFGGYILFTSVRLLKNPFLYLGILITIIFIAPAINWSLNNNLSNINFHIGRMQLQSIHLSGFLREIIGEGIYLNPIVFGLVLNGVLRRKKAPLGNAQKGIVLLLWLSLPLIFTVQFLSLFNDTLPHWNGMAYCTLLPLAAIQLRKAIQNRLIPTAIKYSLGLLVAAVLILLILVKAYPGSLGNGRMPALGKNDITLDMCGWRSFAQDFTKQFGGKPTVVLTDYWFPAGHLNFYLPEPFQVMAVGPLQNIHQFAWINDIQRSLQPGDDAFYISVSNFYSPPGPVITNAFTSIEPVIKIPQRRSGKIVRYFYIYPLRDYRGGIPANGLIAGTP